MRSGLLLPLTLLCAAQLMACRGGSASESFYTGGAWQGGGVGDPAGGSGAGNGAGAGSAGGASGGVGSAASGAGNGAASGAGTSTGGGALPSGSSSNSSSGTGTTSGGGGGGNGSGGGSYLVFASTDTELYALDPSAPGLPLTYVGDFDCIDPVNGPHTSMVDIAVDRFQHLFGITTHSVFPLLAAGGVVHCGAEIPIVNAQPGQWVPTFYGLTFAPKGVLDPAKEVLVAGNTAGELWSISAEGVSAKHGSFGAVPADDGHGHPYDAANVGKPWELSGDIVFLANGNDPVGFATVRDCPNPPSPVGCSKTDTLIEIDMAKFAQASPGAVTKAVRGKILKAIGCGGADGLVSGSMFGIAAWNDAVFGFSRTGSFVSIATADAAGCLLKNYPQHAFSGAGVTTLAPVIVPPLQ